MSHVLFISTNYTMEVLPECMAAFRRVILREPDGRRTGLVFASLSFVCLLMWVYIGVLLDGSHFLLFMGVAFGCSGCAEALPTGRRRTAGGLRIVAIGLMLSLIVGVAFAPEYIV